MLTFTGGSLGTLRRLGEATPGASPFVVGQNWNGPYPEGTRLLYTNNAFSGSPFGDAMTINFTTPVTEFGVLASGRGDQLFSFTVFNGAQVLGTFSGVGNSLTGSFLGARATNADVITRAVLTNVYRDFVTGPLTFANADRNALIPEPTTLLLLGTGIAGVTSFSLKVKTRRESK